MLNFIFIGLFLAFWVWVRRRQTRSDLENDRLETRLAETQKDLEQVQHQGQLLVGFLSALGERKVSPTGQVDWQPLCDFAVKMGHSLIGAGQVVLLRWDPVASEYAAVAAHGFSPQDIAQLKVHRGEGVLGRSAQMAKTLVAQDHSAITPLPQEKFLVPPYLVLPLWVHAQVQGLLVFSGFPEAPLAPGRVRLATLVAKHLELTMDNLDLHESRTRVYGELVMALNAALGAREPDAHHHAQHCRDLVRRIGKEMHLPELLIEQIEYGALLHDVGKLGLSEAILDKPGPLTPEEYAQMKKHPEIGARILQGVDFLKAVAPIVQYHHEWVNGQGYPEGLAGEEIPLGARIISIVDAWDAMTAPHPYRTALPRSNAIAELRQQAGSQFDPRLVDVFVRVVDQLEPNV